MTYELGPFSAVAALPKPLPVRHGDWAGAAIAIVVRDGWLSALVVDSDGAIASIDITGQVRAVPQPGDDLRMAVGWAVETPTWTSRAAERRNGR
jgi:hypothetical protein